MNTWPWKLLHSHAENRTSLFMTWTVKTRKKPLSRTFMRRTLKIYYLQQNFPRNLKRYMNTKSITPPPPLAFVIGWQKSPLAYCILSNRGHGNTLVGEPAVSENICLLLAAFTGKDTATLPNSVHITRCAPIVGSHTTPKHVLIRLLPQCVPTVWLAGGHTHIRFIAPLVQSGNGHAR